MQEVDSQVLQTITKVLQLGGRGSQHTEFDDGILQQSLDVAPLVRRGGTIIPTDGMFTAVMETIHAAANTQTATQTPYDLPVPAPVGSFIQSPYPFPIGPEFDLWLLSADVNVQSGTGTTDAGLTVIYPAALDGWGNVAAPGARGMFYGVWDTEVAVGPGIQLAEVGTDKLSAIWNPVRLPRGGTLRFRTVSTGIVTFRCTLLLGLFPAGLGQDVVSGPG